LVEKYFESLENKKKNQEKISENRTFALKKINL